MKREYEEPQIVIELFQDQDVIVCSDYSGEIPGDGDEPIFGGNGYRNDA